MQDSTRTLHPGLKVRLLAADMRLHKPPSQHFLRLKSSLGMGNLVQAQRSPGMVVESQ